ncbi:MAG: DUF3727 domain-containing protein [Xenococcaceae cyanobacterium MO_188.B29]|nr:DUF3727 domain-containing protein [Xenococcaceae cyanobacterium MO_188.B29]
MSSSQFDPDNEQYEAETVTLKDQRGNSLDCYIEHALESDGIVYLLLMPVDIPVVIISWEDGNNEEDEALEAIMLEEYEEIEMVFADAKAVLAEQNLYLQHTAYTLTVTGELPPIEEDNILTLNLDEEDSQLESEELQFLASFYHSQQKYSIYTPLTPLLFFARQNSDGELEFVSPDEEKFQPILEELLFEELE